jgi:hypothetical protein
MKKYTPNTYVLVSVIGKNCDERQGMKAEGAGRIQTAILGGNMYIMHFMLSIPAIC